HGFTLKVSGGQQCGCLIGTTLYVMGEEYIASERRYTLMAKHFPIISEIPPCPVCNDKLVVDRNADMFYGIGRPPGSAAECLYENHGWSKKAVAEWVETIENKLEAESLLSSGHQDTVTVQASAPVSSETVKV